MVKLSTDIRQSKRLQELGLSTKTADLSFSRRALKQIENERS